MPSHQTAKFAFKIYSDVVWWGLKLENMSYYISIRKLHCTGHFVRMPMTRLPRQFLTSRVNEHRFHGRPQYTYGHTLTKTLTRSGIPSDFKIWWGKADTRQEFMVQLLLCNSKVPFKSPTLKLKAILPFLYIFNFARSVDSTDAQICSDS